MIDNTAKAMLLIICMIIALQIIKVLNSPLAKIIVSFAVVLILIFSINYAKPIVDFISNLSRRAGIDSTYFKIIIKSVGICILGEFTSKLCIDHGENALSANAEFLCKTSIILLALPIYSEIFNMVLKLWEN